MKRALILGVCILMLLAGLFPAWAAAEKWICPVCGRQNIDGAQFCANCGIALEDINAKFCPNCWYRYGEKDNFCPYDGTQIGYAITLRDDYRLISAILDPPVTDTEPYDMGKPDLEGRSYPKSSMNIIVFWVQTQLKATGQYYQGDEWNITGNLGDHTREEIARFMIDRGYPNHPGTINQAVVDELWNALWPNIVPVYVGGFYRYMHSILISSYDDSMNHITEESWYNQILWVQICLNRLGYLPHDPNGQWTTETETAVRRFQKDHGFVQRSNVSLGVARAMLEDFFYTGNDLRRLSETEWD